MQATLPLPPPIGHCNLQVLLLPTTIHHKLPSSPQPNHPPMVSEAPRGTRTTCTDLRQKPLEAQVPLATNRSAAPIGEAKAPPEQIGRKASS